MISITTVILGIPVIGVGLYFLREYIQGPVCKSDARLDGKVVIITGANTGIGRINAQDHVQRGAKVILACRSEQRGTAAVEEIKKETGEGDSKIKFMKLDLSSMKSVKSFAEEFRKSEKQLDILINNAGVMYSPFTLTEDGFEQQFGVNHLGHFYLTNLLLDMIIKSAPSRIVNVASLGHSLTSGIKYDKMMDEASYNRYDAYHQSKLANVLFTKELAKRLQGKNVTVYSLHPGAVNTELMRHLSFLYYPGLKTIVEAVFKVFIKDPFHGAQTQITCAVDPALANETGKYYSDCAEKEPSKASQDEAAARKLWDHSVKLLGLKAEDMVV